MTKGLTTTRVESEGAGAKRREIPDGFLPGLYLVVQPSGAKSWAVRYRSDGRSRKLTIGLHPAIDLATARRQGATALRAAAEGRDPACEKQAAKTAAKRASAEEVRAKLDLYENVARDFITRHAIKNNREATWRENARILGFRVDPFGDLIEAKGDALQAWRGRKIQDITKRDVIALLDQVGDRGSPIMANRVLAAVRKLFNWCLARDVIQSSPCAMIEPPAPERSRERILDDAELAAIWNASRIDMLPFGPLVRLLILTGQRLNEVAGMRWSEIDANASLWTLPPERVKNGTTHEVALSEEALATLATVPRIKTPQGFVFTAVRGLPVSSFSRGKHAIDAAIAAGGEPLAHWTFHDLRRTMASGMARLGIQLPVIEKILNHSSGTFRGVVGVYQRHSFAEEKREALMTWAKHVEALVQSDTRAK